MYSRINYRNNDCTLKNCQGWPFFTSFKNVNEEMFERNALVNLIENLSFFFFKIQLLFKSSFFIIFVLNLALLYVFL